MTEQPRRSDLGWCRRRLLHAAWSYWNSRHKQEVGTTSHAEVMLRHTEMLDAAFHYYQAREEQLDRSVKTSPE